MTAADPAKAPALARRCPKCHAAPHTHCHGPAGHPMRGYAVHAARWPAKPPRQPALCNNCDADLADHGGGSDHLCGPCYRTVQLRLLMGTTRKAAR